MTDQSLFEDSRVVQSCLFVVAVMVVFYILLFNVLVGVFWYTAVNAFFGSPFASLMTSGLKQA